MIPPFETLSTKKRKLTVVWRWVWWVSSVVKQAVEGSDVLLTVLLEIFAKELPNRFVLRYERLLQRNEGVKSLTQVKLAALIELGRSRGRAGHFRAASNVKDGLEEDERYIGG